MTTARKIAYLCLQATTEGQASHAHVHEIISGLRDLGHTVTLFEPAYAAGAAPGALGRIREFKRIQRELARTIRDYDVVYVRAHPLAIDTSRAARRAGVPTVVECNGPIEDVFTAWPAVRPARRLIEHWQLSQYRLAAALIAVTPELATWLEGSVPTPVSVVANGANTDLFTPDAPRLPELPERYAVFFGALAAWQGVPTLIDAVSKPQWPEGISLVIAGDGALRPEVESAAAADPRIVYVGRIPYADIPRVIAHATASLSVQGMSQRSRTGLSPLKLYESMAAGVPVIVSDFPGLADTVRESACGEVVTAGDAEAVASAVARIASDPAAATQMGARGRAAAVEQHSWRARARLTADVIESAVAREATCR